MGQKSWPEERAEIAIWLSGFLGTYSWVLTVVIKKLTHQQFYLF